MSMEFLILQGNTQSLSEVNRKMAFLTIDRRETKEEITHITELMQEYNDEVDRVITAEKEKAHEAYELKLSEFSCEAEKTAMNEAKTNYETAHSDTVAKESEIEGIKADIGDEDSGLTKDIDDLETVIGTEGGTTGLYGELKVLQDELGNKSTTDERKKELAGLIQEKQEEIKGKQEELNAKKEEKGKKLKKLKTANNELMSLKMTESGLQKTWNAATETYNTKSSGNSSLTQKAFNEYKMDIDKIESNKKNLQKQYTDSLKSNLDGLNKKDARLELTMNELKDMQDMLKAEKESAKDSAEKKAEQLAPKYG